MIFKYSVDLLFFHFLHNQCIWWQTPGIGW